MVVRPRPDSNGQPADSKSVTLSIELRGQDVMCKNSVEAVFDGGNFTRDFPQRGSSDRRSPICSQSHTVKNGGGSEASHSCYSCVHCKKCSLRKRSRWNRQTLNEARLKQTKENKS